MTGDMVWTTVSGVSGATALGQLASAQPGHAMQSLPYTWTQAFLGTIPGSMGETSTLACLIGAIILLATSVASWRVMASMLLGGLGLCLLVLADCKRHQSDARNPAALASRPWRLCLRSRLHGHRGGRDRIARGQGQGRCQWQCRQS